MVDPALAKWCPLLQAESQQEKNLTKYAGSIYAYAKKAEKIGRANEKGG